MRHKISSCKALSGDDEEATGGLSATCSGRSKPLACTMFRQLSYKEGHSPCLKRIYSQAREFWSPAALRAWERAWASAFWNWAHRFTSVDGAKTYWRKPPTNCARLPAGQEKFFPATCAKINASMQ